MIVGQHGLGPALRLHGDGRRGEPGLPPGGHQQGVRDPHHHLRGDLDARRRQATRRAGSARCGSRASASPSGVYELRGLGAPTAAEQAETIKAFEAAVDALAARRLDEAEAGFQAGARPPGPRTAPRAATWRRSRTAAAVRAELGRRVHRDHEVCAVAVAVSIDLTPRCEPPAHMPDGRRGNPLPAVREGVPQGNGPLPRG